MTSQKKVCEEAETAVDKVFVQLLLTPLVSFSWLPKNSSPDTIFVAHVTAKVEL